MNGLPGSSRQWARCLWLACLLLATLPSVAQDSSALWTKRDLPPGLKPPPEVLNFIAVNVKVGVLRSDARLTLLLPDGDMLVIDRKRLVQTPKGVVWLGIVEKQPTSTASFASVGEAVAGSILTAKGRSYRLRQDPSGVHLLEEIDLRKLPHDGKPATAYDQGGAGSGDSAADTCITDSREDIDVMVLYTADALGSSTIDALESEIILSMEEANQSYINSDVAQRLRLTQIAQVSYPESGIAATDLDRLKHKSDGFLDNVHTLRDSHGADVVTLITKTLDECGKATQMEVVSNAFESSAFLVVKRTCMVAGGKFTFPHELGHLMGARHDWGDDGGVTPFLYSHGHVEATPSTGPPWRTMMAYDDSCASGCSRLLYWSNPAVDINGIATGVAGGSSPEDNHRALNDTARTVANFRCASPGRSDVWMKDTWNDTGSEPDPAQAGQPMWESQDIWVRTTQDPSLVHQHDHQNPVSGQTNFIYVKAHIGSAAFSGNLEVSVANATTGLSWPASWTALPAIPLSGTGGAATRILEVPWTPTSSGHVCLVARWLSASDPMTTPEGNTIEPNVRANNNIVWRNLQVIDLGGDDSSVDAWLEVPGAGKGQSFVVEIRPVPSWRSGRSHGPHFLDFGRVTLTLDERLTEAWREVAFEGKGLRREGNVVTITSHEGAQLKFNGMDATARARIRFSRVRDSSYPRDKFSWRVIMFPTDDSKPRATGGITYEVRTTAP